MANIKISELEATTARTLQNVVAIINDNQTKKVTVENLTREPVTDGGSVSGSIPVDLSVSRWFKFELIGDASVVFSNVVEGSTYLFWVYATGSYTVSSMTISGGGSVYSVGGTLPNPNNNSWNLYQAYAVNGDLVLTEIGNFSAV